MKLTITSDLLGPENKKSIEYSGYHVSRILKSMSEILKNSLKVEGADIFEEKLKWDVSGDPIEFYASIRAKNGMDSHSTVWIKVVIQGTQNKKDRMGNVKITLKGSLETEFSVNYFTKSIVSLYNYFFYSNKRREYIEEGRMYIERVENEIRSMFNLMERARAS